MRDKKRHVEFAALVALLAIAMTMSMSGCARTSSDNQTNESTETVVVEAGYGPQSKAVEKEIIDEANKLPSKVDLRDLDGMNYVTLVKLQDPYASCWTFGIAGAAEISSYTITTWACLPEHPITTSTFPRSMSAGFRDTPSPRTR